jgi:hypothetical protein
VVCFCVRCACVEWLTITEYSYKDLLNARTGSPSDTSKSQPPPAVTPEPAEVAGAGEGFELTEEEERELAELMDAD